MFVFALNVFAGRGGAAKLVSINIFIQTVLCTTDGVGPPPFFYYLRSSSCISEANRLPFFQEVLSWKLWTATWSHRIKKKKLEVLHNEASVSGAHPSFFLFFFPCQIELLEVDISGERKGSFLLQPECAISWKPVVSIALRPRGGKPMKKRDDGRVEDKEADGDGLLMDSTVPQCQFPFLIGGLFLKDKPWRNRLLIIPPRPPLTVTRLYFPDRSEPEALALCFLLLSNINDNGPFLWDYFNQNQRYK